MVIDRGDRAAGSACGAGLPACAAGSACEDGACRSFTCQQYVSVSGGAIDYSAVQNIVGDCPCGGAERFDWANVSSSAPPRVRRAITRDGVITTMNYDSSGRLIARCIGDDAADAGWDANTCPNTAEWTAW